MAALRNGEAFGFKFIEERLVVVVVVSLDDIIAAVRIEKHNLKVWEVSTTGRAGLFFDEVFGSIQGVYRAIQFVSAGDVLHVSRVVCGL